MTKKIKLSTEAKASETFNQYTIKWDKYKANFSLATKEGKFYGSYRKSRVNDTEGSDTVTIYAVDIWAEYGNKTYVVECIYYEEKDPRCCLSSLNADICAAVNKWLYLKCKGTLKSLGELQHKSDKPVITIKKSATLDQIIHRLREFRDTALGHGGSRALIIEGDNEGDPQVTIKTDLSSETDMLKGQVPALFGADVTISLANRKKSGGHTSLGENESIKSLLDQLRNTSDKAQQRKLRGALRRLGYHGGLRNKTVASESKSIKYKGGGDI